jgi:TonB family protein
MLAPALLASWSTVAVSEETSDVFQEVGTFTVFQQAENDECRALTSFKSQEYGQEVFAASYSVRENRVVLTFTSNLTTSLPERGEVDVELVFLENGSEDYDDGWSDRTTSYSRDDKGRYYFNMGFSGSENAKQILEDLAKSVTIGFFYEDKMITGFPLKGSAKAVSALEACAFAIADLNPRDPFAAGLNPRASAEARLQAGARPPKPVAQSGWARRIQENYPSAALREARTGKVALTVSVGADGMVTSCSVAGSSGHADLDEAACQGMQRYARFEPAQDDVGQAVAGEWSSVISYSLN